MAWSSYRFVFVINPGNEVLLARQIWEMDERVEQQQHTPAMKHGKKGKQENIFWR